MVWSNTTLVKYGFGQAQFWSSMTIVSPDMVMCNMVKCDLGKHDRSPIGPNAFLKYVLRSMSKAKAKQIGAQCC